MVASWLNDLMYAGHASLGREPAGTLALVAVAVLVLTAAVVGSLSERN